MEKELTIRETQSIALEILKQVAEICEQQEFRYCLMYGTLLGAVRHKGFIPWDDDIDIMMPREDYERLLVYLHQNRDSFPELEVFEPDTNPAYPYMIARVSDRRYRIDTENEDDYGMGVFMDIYPFDGLGNTAREAYQFGIKGDRLSSFCFQSTRQHFEIGTTTSVFRKIVKYPVFVVSKCLGKTFFMKRLRRLAGVKSYDNSEYVGCAVWLTGGKRDIFQRKWFEEFILAPFEQYEFRIPKDYDQVLTNNFGDYMQLPPEKDRVGHHNYQVYRRK